MFPAIKPWPMTVAKEFLHFIFGHLHKMVLVEPANVLRREVGCDREDCLARDLAGFGRMLESTISICTFFTFASKTSTQFNGQVLGEDIGWIDVRILEEEHSHFLPVFGRAVNLATFFSLFCLLTRSEEVVSSTVLGVVGSHLSPRCCAGRGELAFLFLLFITDAPSFCGHP